MKDPELFDHRCPPVITPAGVAIVCGTIIVLSVLILIGFMFARDPVNAVAFITAIGPAIGAWLGVISVVAFIVFMILNN